MAELFKCVEDMQGGDWCVGCIGDIEWWRQRSFDWNESDGYSTHWLDDTPQEDVMELIEDYWQIRFERANLQDTINYIKSNIFTDKYHFLNLHELEEENIRWTRQKIIDEVTETLDFEQDNNDKDIYHDNQGIWEDKSIEELIERYVDNEDQHFVTEGFDEDDIYETRKFIYDFCVAAKKFFNMGNDLDEYIEEYKGE